MGYGGEYRYVASAGSNGKFRIYRLSEHATDVQRRQRHQPSARASRCAPTSIQALPAGFRARGSIDYFSDVTVQQQYQMDLYNATLRTAQLSGQRLGRARPRQQPQRHLRHQRGLLRRRRLADRSAAGRASSSTAPPTKLGRSPLYFAGPREYAQLARIDKSAASRTDRTTQSLTRIDVARRCSSRSPSGRACRLRSSITWHNTYWSESLVPTGARSRTRSRAEYFDMRSQLHRPDPHARSGTRPRTATPSASSTSSSPSSRPADDDVRRLRPDRQDRGRRLHLRRHDAPHLRRDQPLPGPAPRRRRRRAGAARRASSSTCSCSSPTTPTRTPARSTAPTAAASSAGSRATSRRSR